MIRSFASLALLAGLAAATAAADTLRIGNGAEPGSLDPQRASGNWETRITRALFARLVGYGPDGALVPGLARRWEISDDGTRYTFHLREAARWSDGTPLTADDAVFALRRLLAPETANHNATLYYPIVGARAINVGAAEPEALGVRAPDPHTLEIRLAEPTAYFLQALAMSEAAPLPRHWLAEAGEDWVRPDAMVVSGAFRLAEWHPQDHITLARNPAYHAADEVALDRVVLYPIDDSGAALNRFRSGQLDISYSGVPSSQFAWAREHLGEALRVGPLVATYFYMFNLHEGQPLADPRVREALNLATRREVIAERLLGMGQRPATWFVPRAVSGATDAHLALEDIPMAQRLSRARALLEAAGYGPDRPLPLRLAYNTLEDHKKVAVAVAAMWRPLGVEVELVNREAAVHFATVREGDFEIARYGMVATIDDPYDFLNAYAEGGSSARASGFRDPAYDALVTASTRALDAGRRRELMSRAEQRLLDAHALLPLYDYVSAHLVAPRVAGWQSTPLDVHPLRYLSLEETP